MKLSTRGIYGLRAICYLAEQRTALPIPLSAIAKDLDLSEHYLEQLVRMLKKADMVESVRGAQGGYRLARGPQDIFVGDVLRVLEGEIQPVHCGNGDDCFFVGDCHAHIVLSRIQKSIFLALDGISLEDLISGRVEA